MSPKVTLLGPPWKSFSFAFGRAMYDFEGGIEKDGIPVAVALELGKKMDSSGQKLFSIVDMPQIVEVEHARMTKTTQNVDGTSPRQLEFEGWH